MRRSTRIARPTLSGSSRSAVLLGNDGDGSTLTLDFTTGQLDPRLTFTRDSNATFINSSGLVQYADANMMARSETLDASPWGLGGITNTEEQVTNPVGGSSCRLLTVSSAGGSKSLVGNMTIAQGFQYTFRIWVRAGTSSAVSLGYFISGFQNSTLTKVSGPGTVSGSGSGANYHTVTGLTSDWTLLQLTLASTTTAGLGGWYIYPNTPTNAIGDSIYVWGAQANIGATANPYYRTTTSAYYAPRFDHDPTTLAPLGLLIEGSVINQFSYSEDFSNGVWSKANTNSAMPLTGTAPDGSSTSRLLEENTTSYAKHSLERLSAITITANNVYTLSVWLKEPSSNSRRYAHIQLADGQATAARYTVVADLQTGEITASGANNGTAGAPTGTAHRITAFPGGWYRVSVSMNHVASPCYPAIMLGDSASLFGGNNQPFYSATTPYKGLLVWGAMLEQGSGASSYIPTGASAVTKNEDTASMTSVASLGFDLFQGTFLVRGRQSKQSTNGSYARTMRLAGGAVEPLGLAVNEATLFGTSRNALGTQIAEATRLNVLGQDFAFGFALNANDATNAMVVSRNGSSTFGTRGALGPTAALTSLGFNTNATATAYAAMAIKSVKFWPVAKTAAELNALTTGA